MVRSRFITNVMAGLPILLLWILVCVFMKETWFTSYNGLTMALWTPLVFGGGIICALASWQEANRLEHHSTAVWLSTPRSWFVVRIREICGGYLLSTFFPVLLSQGILLSVGIVLSLPGYLDLRYAFYALSFSFILYLMGTLTAHLNLGFLRSAILALFLGIYAGMYIVLTKMAVETWDILRPASWEVIVACLVVLIIVIAIVTACRTITVSMSRIISGMGIFGTIAVIFFLGGTQTSGYFRTDYENILCENSKETTLCIWKEDSFKMQDIYSYLQRTRDVRNEAGMQVVPILAIEPAIPQGQVKSAKEMEKQDYLLTYISSFGGKTPSWPAAQSFADILFTSNVRCAAEAPEKFNLLYDLLTNFIYGDISYNGFSTSNSEQDEIRLDYSKELSLLNEEEQRVRLASALASFNATCSYDSEEFLSHG